MKYLLIALLLSCGTPINYPLVFGEDYQSALHFLDEQKLLFTKVSQQANIDASILEAIVFPELIRYSAFQDFFETQSLVLAYVNGGKSVADFSIGRFQMKPSFVERLEAYLLANPSISSETKITHYIVATEKAIRKERVSRLQQLEWQLNYLSAFVEVCEHKFSTYLSTANTEEKIKCLAAAYNVGFQYSLTTILEQSKQATFPYGAKYPPQGQHCYVDIAWDYFNKK